MRLLDLGESFARTNLVQRLVQGAEVLVIVHGKMLGELADRNVRTLPRGSAEIPRIVWQASQERAGTLSQAAERREEHHGRRHLIARLDRRIWLPLGEAIQIGLLLGGDQIHLREDA